MSKETALPPDGSDLHPQHAHSRLSGAHDACEGRTSGSTKRPKKTQSSRGLPAKGHVTREEKRRQEEEEEEEEEELVHGQPVRTQPQPSTSEPGRGGGASSCSPNGLRYHVASAGDQRVRPSTRDAATAAGGAQHSRVPHACSCGAGLAPNERTAAEQQPQPRRQLSLKPTPVSQKMQRKLRSSLSVDSDSKGSSAGSQKAPLPEDCCVHCILACLFCEFLSLCSMVTTGATCGVCTPDVCCCCCGGEEAGGGEDCNCPCDMDCGVMDACCESSDCLEFCMECCGICFPT